ncbi:MAG: hypothetical protein IKL04_09430 [Lachnospiraceae bacterium]|nr:hypothetical protein [Lachnospiraceae bacterium]
MDKMVELTLLTQYGREMVENYSRIREALERLSAERTGFVRLKVSVAGSRRHYLETSYDAQREVFYTCVLESGAAGQFFWETEGKKVPQWRFRRVSKKRCIDGMVLIGMEPGPVGRQRRVLFEGMREAIKIIPFEIQNIVYGGPGSYGADQDSPCQVSPRSERGRLFARIIRKYYPEYNDQQIRAFLRKLSSEGCGYAVIVNTLLEYYADKQAEYEAEFGFAYLNENGSPDYEALMLDFYAATDNHMVADGADVIDFEEDKDEKEEPYDYTMDRTGNGTNFDKRIYRTGLYLKNKNIKFKITNHKKVTLANVRTFSEFGRIMISLNGGNVQNEDGSVYAYCRGHSMVITGVTSDCRYIVSTWGLKKYVDPFEVVEKDGKKTRIYYQYFEVGPRKKKEFSRKGR